MLSYVYTSGSFTPVNKQTRDLTPVRNSYVVSLDNAKSRVSLASVNEALLRISKIKLI